MAEPEIIKEAREYTLVSSVLRFYYYPTTGGYYAFPCDEHGDIAWDKLYPAGFENLKRLLADFVAGKNVEMYVDTERCAGRDSAILRCPCGAEVMLESFTNCCDACGQYYNMSGQRILPPDQWGEDCLNDDDEEVRTV